MFMLEHLTIICQCAGVKFTAIETSNDNHDSLINSLAASDVLKREYWVYKYRVCPIPWHSFRLCRLLSFVKTVNIKRNGQICMKELRTVTIQGQTKKIMWTAMEWIYKMKIPKHAHFGDNHMHDQNQYKSSRCTNTVTATATVTSSSGN